MDIETESVDKPSFTLINPPSSFLLSERVMAPLGILYIASVLKKEGVKVNFIDLAGRKDLEEACKEIPCSHYYGLTSTTPQFPSVQEILKYIPQEDTVLGGPQATVAPKMCVEAGFDNVVVGDGENGVLDFLRGKRGIIRSEPIKNLDEVPFPDRSLVKDYNYSINNIPATTMVTSRGCAYGRCSFCSQSNLGIRFRSVENVVEELKQIRSLGYRALMIYDDELFFNKRRDLKICYWLSKLGFIWRCFSRSDLIDEKIASAAQYTGCKEILLGIESGSDIILKNINKGTTVAQNRRAIKTLHENKIRVKSAMIIMLPGESHETLRETWEFCEEMEPYVSAWDFTTCVAYPGSEIYRDPTKFDFNFDEKAMFSAYKGGGSSVWIPPKVWTKELSYEVGLKYRKLFEDRFKSGKKNLKFKVIKE